MKRLTKELELPKITFYDKLHKTKVEYTEFENLIIKRMKILKEIENLKFEATNYNMNNIEEDIESHFYCRLLCSQDFWSAKWLTSMEVQLFRKKISVLNQSWIEKYFKHSFFRNISNIDVSRNQITHKSQFTPTKVHSYEFNDQIYVHFTKVCDLLASRKIKISKGYTKLSTVVINSCLTNFYSDFLESKMRDLHYFNLMNPDERLKKLHEQIFSTKKDVFMSSSLESCLRYLPPCIEGLMAKLKKNRHLKYNDRQTLCLFFKECGVDVEENVKFMRASFSTSKEVFDKEYLYGIRHNYGLEGRKAQYSCFSCQKIISFKNDGNSYGCPLSKGRENIDEYLNIKNINIPEIEDLLKENNPQKVCTGLLSKIIRKDTKIVSSPIDFYRECKENKE